MTTEPVVPVGVEVEVAAVLPGPLSCCPLARHVMHTGLLDDMRDELWRRGLRRDEGVMTFSAGEVDGGVRYALSCLAVPRG